MISPPAIRIFNREHDGTNWIYLDQDEAEFAYIVLPEYSIDSIDNFIEGRQGVNLPEGARQQLIEMRHDALQAFKTKNFALMMAHAKALTNACYVFGMLKDAKHGAKFSKGRKANTSGPIRKAIQRLLKKSQALKNSELWEAIANRPPKGWEPFNNSMGRYMEGPKAGEGMSYARFCNVASEERRKLKL
jgi:hypothetical protein